MRTDSEQQRVTLAYVRLTRDGSIEAGLSIPGQKDAIAYYAERVNLGPVTYLVEPSAVGGDIPFEDRTEGRKLVAEISAGRVSDVVVRDIDRLTRDEIIWPNFRNLCIHHRVSLHTIMGRVPIESADDRFSTGVTVLAAQREKQKTSERSKHARRQLAIQGRHAGATPYGYSCRARKRRELVTAGVPEEAALQQAEALFPVRGLLCIDKGEAKVVRKIFQLYVERRLGTRKISRELNRLGFRRREGKPWHPDKVRRIINDPTVAGFTAHDEERFQKGYGRRQPKHGQTLHQGRHAPIILELLWRKAQEVKVLNTSRKKGKPLAANRRYALSGVLECACGATMSACSQQYKGSGELKFGYYCCRRRRDYGPDVVEGCAEPRVSIARADEAFWTAISRILATPELVDRVYVAVCRIATEREADPIEETAAERLQKVESDIARWYQRHDDATNELEKDAAWRRVTELIARQRLLLDETAKAPVRAAPQRSFTKQQIKEFLGGLVSVMRKPNDPGKSVIRSLTEHHGLRVRLPDSHRIQVSLALVPPNAGASPTVEETVPVETIEDLPRNRVDQWLAENDGKCMCGICGKAIKVLRRHVWLGLPRFHHKCWASQITRRRSNPDPAKYLNGVQAAAVLGISRTEFGRWRTAGKVKELKRVGNVLLFSKRCIESLAAQLRKSSRLKSRT